MLSYMPRHGLNTRQVMLSKLPLLAVNGTETAWEMEMVCHDAI